jgi:hypothetical protein
VMYKAAIDAFPLISGSVVMLYVRASCWLLIWFSNDIYFLRREFRRQLSLCVSRWAFPTIIQHGLLWLRWTQGAPRARCVQ